MRREVRRCTRYSYWFAVLSVDLTPSDEAEALLQMVAEVVGSDVRETDVVGRLPGRRFGVILLHAEFGDACLIAERIRERLGSDPGLASLPEAFGADAFRTVVFPEMASDAETMFRELGIPGDGDRGDDEGGPGAAPIGAFT